MLPLKYQHRSQPHGALARPSDVDPNALGLLQHLVASGRVPRDECALALAAQILDLVWVFVRKGG